MIWGNMKNQDNSFSVLSLNMNRSKRLFGGKTFYYIGWHLETTSNMNSILKWRVLGLFLWKHETCDQIMVKWQDWKVRLKYSQIYRLWRGWGSKQFYFLALTCNGISGRYRHPAVPSHAEDSPKDWFLSHSPGASR